MLACDAKNRHKSSSERVFLNNFEISISWVPDSCYRKEGKHCFRELFENVRVNAVFFGISGFWVGIWASSFLRLSDAKCLRFGLPLRFGLRCKCPQCQIASDVGRAMRTQEGLWRSQRSKSRSAPGSRGQFSSSHSTSFGPVLRDTARLSQRYPLIARYGVFGVSDGPILRDTARLSQRYPLIARYGVFGVST